MANTEGYKGAGEPQSIVAREITIVDPEGKPRIRMQVEGDGTPVIKFLDQDEQLRMALYVKPAEGTGLLITDPNHSATIRLEVGEDGLTGHHGRLEIAEGPTHPRKIHRFPPRPVSQID